MFSSFKKMNCYHLPAIQRVVLAARVMDLSRVHQTSVTGQTARSVRGDRDVNLSYSCSRDNLYSNERAENQSSAL